MSDGLATGITRRRLLQAAGTMGLGWTLIGCGSPGGGGDDDAAATTPTPTTGAGAITGTISFAHWRGEDRAVLDRIIADFIRENPGVTVEQDIAPSRDYQATALLRLRDGAVGDAFTAFRGAQFEDMQTAGLFADLTGQDFVANYQPQYIEEAQVDDQQLGLPYLLVFNMPLVNTALLEQAGISEFPRAWDGYLAMCEDLLAAGKVPIVFAGASAANANQLVNSMVMNNAPSPDMFTKMMAGEYKTTDDWFIKTLENYAELRPFIQENALGTQAEPAQQMFADQTGAMLVAGSYYLGVIRQLGATFPMDVLAPVTVAEVDATYFGVHNTTFILGVNAHADNQAGATRFIEYLSDPAVASTYANGTLQHLTVEGVEYTSPDLKALEHWFEEETILAPLFQFTNLDARAAVENACLQVIGGTASVEQAAEDAQRIVDQNL